MVDGESEEDGSGVSSVLMLIDLGHDDATQYYCTAENFLAVVLNLRHNRSQSPVFGLAVLYPTESEI